jgi:hypothetical protein
MRLQPLTGRISILTMTGLTCLATTVACGSGGAPELSGLTDQVAQVGTELKIDLMGTDPDGDQLTYGFRAADLADVNDRAAVSVSPSGAGVFRWTPLGSDVGEHAFDFTVSDGDNTTTVTINIDVRSAIGSATAPIFRQPLGSGTTLDLARKDCIDLDIVLEDQDNAQVTLTQEEPVIEGATLNQTDGLNATWQWCPTKEQEAENRYTLVLGADDGSNPKTLKNYLLVLRGGGGTNCPGGAPSISHTPSNESTVLDLTIDARVTDDKGLKEEPLFYYSLTPPTTPPDLGSMIQLSTLHIDGTPTNSIYAADVPNPVAGMAAGAQRTIYYVFVADDDDDEMGNCDHSTVSQVYTATITSTGQADLPICAACSSDSQCGIGDLCTYVGSTGNSYCMQACGAGCPTGYTCSAGTVYSVDGAEAVQCVPQSGSCEMPSGTCEDDENEDDDSRSQASANPAAVVDQYYGMISCPKAVQTSGSNADDDWFKIVLAQDAILNVGFLGGTTNDLDLHLYKSDGTVLSRSTQIPVPGQTSSYDEEIEKCLKAGTYYTKVNGYGIARNEYLYSYFTQPPAGGSCDTACVDDSREDDDVLSQARPTVQPYSSTGNSICPDDRDWYRVNLTQGQRLTVNLLFEQDAATEDLDIHIHNSSGFDLTPCEPGNTDECSEERGQGIDSDEHTVFTAPATGTYYVVVVGYDGSANSYSINTSVQ